MPSIFLICGLLLAGVWPSGAQGPVEIELRVREGALLSLEQAGLAQPGADWRERYWALEALNRREPGRISVSEEQLAGRFLLDKHPNVRALALAVHARHRLTVPASVEALLDDPLPAVRTQLARALVHCVDDRATHWLAQLVLDEDPAVAREASAQFFGMGSDALIEQQKLLVEHWSALAPELFLQILDVLDLSNDSALLIQSMVAVFADPPASMGSGSKFRARLALWATLAEGELQKGWIELLVEHWLTPLEPERANVEGLRRRRLEHFGAPLALRQRLVASLLDRAQASDALARAGGEAAIDAQWEASQWINAAVEAHYALPAHDADLKAGQDWPAPAAFPMGDGWSAALGENAWVACFGRADSWDATALGGLQQPSEDVRLAAWDTLSEIWSRSGGLDPQPWLAEALQDATLAPAVYRSFLRSDRSLPDGDALHAWWAAQETGLQLELLREHAAERVEHAWRSDLIRLWAKPEGKTRVLLELFTKFHGDDQLARRLMPALEQRLGVLESGPVPPKQVTRGKWRAAEAWATWLLQAWLGTRSQDSAGVAQRLQLLLRVGKLGKELGKLLVSDLARTGEGLDGLASIMQAPELSSRVRYEILLTHDDLPQASQIDELFRAYSNCDEELQLRILKRAGQTGSSLAQALLMQVVFERSTGPALRQEAVASIRQLRPNARAVELLSRVLNEVADYELKQASTAALGEIATDLDSLTLLQRYSDPLERSLMGDELLLAMISIEVRTQKALSPEVLAHWRAAPSAASAAELTDRFVSRRLPARNFTYSGWLAAASQLAHAGWLEDALGPDWWTWDARLLMRLAELVEQSGGPQQSALVGRLREAARVALLGEGHVGERPGLLVRLRTRALLSALAAGDWGAALARVGVLLDGWRAGRSSAAAIESVLGPSVPGLRDPRSFLLAIEIECRARLALAAGDGGTLAKLLPRVLQLSRSPSRRARSRLNGLLPELRAAQLRREPSKR